MLRINFLEHHGFILYFLIQVNPKSHQLLVRSTQRIKFESLVDSNQGFLQPIQCYESFAFADIGFNEWRWDQHGLVAVADA